MKTILISVTVLPIMLITSAATMIAAVNFTPALTIVLIYDCSPQPHVHTLTHTQRHIHTLTHTHTNIHTHTHTHTRTHTHTHAHTHARTHTYMHAQIHTHTPTLEP